MIFAFLAKLVSDYGPHEIGPGGRDCKTPFKSIWAWQDKHPTYHSIIQGVRSDVKNYETGKEDIKNELKSQGVTKVQFMKRPKGLQLIPANSYILVMHSQKYLHRSKLASWFVTKKWIFQIPNVALILKNMVTTNDSAKSKKICEM